MEAVVLGSGGWIPTATRETCCALVREDERALLLDAGTGIRRLLERRDLLAGVARLDIVLTHFHLDHLVGLTYLPALGLADPPAVWGPGELAYGSSTRSILERVIGSPFFGAPLQGTVGDVRELRADENEVGSFELRVRVQERHADPTLALRIGDQLGYCTDTALDPANVGFSAGCRVLAHEAWHAADTSEDAGHTAAGDAARVAEEAGVDELVLIHLDPRLDREDELAAHATRIFSNSRVAGDLMRVV